MPKVTEEFLLQLLQACAPGPLYPARHAKEKNLERTDLDAGLDELRRRGLVRFTEWVKDAGQGYALTEIGTQALAARRLPTAAVAVVEATATSGAISTYDRGEMVRAAVLTPGIPYASWTLLIVNLLFFAQGAVFVLVHNLSIVDYFKGICETADGTPALYEFGALWPPRTVPEAGLRRFWRPQLERMLLFLFLHAGALHLMMNMGFLATMAREIEAMWGWARFLTIYFVAGIVSGCVIILISRLEQFRGPSIPFTVGASGPLCGLFTAMVVWFALNYEHLPENLMQEWSRTLSISLFLLLAVNFMPNVSWQGHFGGAVGGLLTALLLHAQRFSSSLAVRVLGLAAVPLIPLGFFLAVLWQAGWF